MNNPISNVDPLFDLSTLNLQTLPDSLSTGQQTENQAGEKFVVFLLDDEFFAVSAERIAEIVRPLELTTLPNSPPWLHGIANLRGAIISVLNLAKLCRKKTSPVSPKSKLIVLKAQKSASSIAFPVDRLSEIVSFKADEVQPAEDFRFIGKALHQNNSVSLLDTEKIFSSVL